MPIYEYVCKECGHKFEKIQPITSEPLKECPNCGKSTIQRVFHPVGVIFRGSGWYITDSRNSNKTSSDKADGDKGSDKAAPAEKSEAKSETSSSGESSSGATAPAKSTD